MDESKRGLIVVKPQLGEYIHGDGRLGDSPLLPSGDWSLYLPPANLQNRDGFEPFCCVTEATLGCVEILGRFLYGDNTRWSRRFLAAASGTGSKQGNDPSTVAETLRHLGCVSEDDYPFNVPTLTEFYKPLSPELRTLAISEFAKYVYGHSWVNPNPMDMMNALTYSPLSVGGYAWSFDASGEAVSPPGSAPEHDFIIYGYVESQYWKVWDSYDPSHKKAEWDFQFTSIKRHTLTRQTVQTQQAQGAWDKFMSLIRSILGL